MPPPRFLGGIDQLEEAGILLDRLRDGTNGPVDPQKISRFLVLTLQHYAPTTSELRSWLLQLWAADAATFPTEEALRQSLLHTKEEYQKINKRKPSDANDFLAGPFVLPSVQLVTIEATDLIRKREIAEAQAATAKAEADRAAVLHTRAVFDNEQREAQLENIRLRLHNASTENNNFRTTVLELEGKLSLANKQKDYFRHECMRVNDLLDKERAKREEYHAEVRSLRAKIERRASSAERQVDPSTLLADRLKQAQQRVTRLENEVRRRDEMIATFTEHCQESGSRVITAKEGRAYSTQVRWLCMKLINSKVPFENIPDVISTVLSMADAQLSELPGERTVRRIAGEESLALAQAQVAEKVLDSTGPLTVQTDETTKFGQQYLGGTLRTVEGDTYVFGLSEMANKSALSTLDILKEKLADLEAISGQEGAAKRIALQIKATMSDRAATEVRFNELLQAYKEDVCPEIVANWAVLSENERAALIQVENFFCSLHLLTNFAESMSRTLLDHEGTIAQPDQLGSLATGTGFQSAEPGVFRLVRTAAKCFARRGTEFGLHSQWRIFLKEKGTALPNFAPFKGNRFNIIFFDAEVTYASRSLLIEFLTTFANNRLHAAVLADLQEPLFIAELKVLALIGKVVTGPLWRLFESEIHVLDLNEYFRKLTDWLDETARDPADFIAGESLPFSRDLLHNDTVFQLLIQPNPDCDAAAAPIASLALSALSVLVKRMCADHLPGGKYYEPDDAMRAATASVPLHNKAPETIFALLDHLIRRRPNASSLTNEAFIMFCMNKTCEWMATKSPEEARALVEAARMNASTLRKLYKHRSRILEEAARQKMLSLQQLRLDKQARAAKRRENRTAEIIRDGLWQSEAEIDSKLASFLSDRQKSLALQRQLRFREQVLQQPPPSGETHEFYQFVVKGQPPSVEKLREKLLRLVSDAASSIQVADSLGLVGKRVEHLFVDSKTRQEKWYKGKVIETVLGFPDFYNIVYDSDPTTPCTYRLGDDLANNELRIL